MRIFYEYSMYLISYIIQEFIYKSIKKESTTSSENYYN